MKRDETAGCNVHIQRFERRYGVSFSQFEAEVLSTVNTLQAHEDYMDWFFWQTVQNTNEQTLNDGNSES